MTGGLRKSVSLTLACAAFAAIDGGCGGDRSDSPRTTSAPVAAARSHQNVGPIANYAGGQTAGESTRAEKGGGQKHAVNPTPAVQVPSTGGGGDPGRPRTRTPKSGSGHRHDGKPKPTAPKHHPAAPVSEEEASSDDPGVSGAVVYEAARSYCGQRDLLQYAPEAIRDDAEALASFAEGFAPAGQQQAAHDGCLEGLRSIGIQP